jgi:hypothetical protein
MQSMNRRELFKAMTAVPFFVFSTNGRKAEYGVNIDPNRQLIVFFDQNVIPEAVSKTLNDNITSKPPIIIPVDVPHGMTIDQVVRFFQGPEEKSNRPK